MDKKSCKAEEESRKAHHIKAYFDDLQSRVAFLAELDGNGRKNEALMLCCCYIEALGSRQSQEPERKAKNYCTILMEHGGSEIWRLIHPKQLRNVLSANGLFKGALGTLGPLIDKFGAQLIEPEQLFASFEASLGGQQKGWLEDNIFKASIANISYERIRSELVHDISAAPIVFSETSYKQKQVPDLNFDMLFSSLRNIVNTSQEKAVATNKWWFD